MVAQIHLLPDEKIVWKGKPHQGFMLVAGEAAFIPFSIFWAGFALFWNINVWRTNADVTFKLFGLPFLVVGFYILIGRFAVDIITRNRTSYVLTNKRVLILGGLNRTSVRSVDLTGLTTTEMDERSDGSGTIRFGVLDLQAVPTSSRVPEFTRIPNVRHVFDLVQRQA